MFLISRGDLGQLVGWKQQHEVDEWWVMGGGRKHYHLEHLEHLAAHRHLCGHGQVAGRVRLPQGLSIDVPAPLLRRDRCSGEAAVLNA